MSIQHVPESQVGALEFSVCDIIKSVFEAEHHGNFPGFRRRCPLFPYLMLNLQLHEMTVKRTRILLKRVGVCV